MLDLNTATTRGFSNMLVSCWHFMGYDDMGSWGEPLLFNGHTGPLPGLV